MRRHAALLLLGAGALLLSPGAAGVPDVPEMVITPVVSGTIGANGWYTSNVTGEAGPSYQSRSKPRGCDIRTLTEDTAGTRLSCSATP